MATNEGNNDFTNPLCTQFWGVKDSFLLDFLFFKEKFVYLRHISDDMPINKNALVRYKILEKWPEKWPNKWPEKWPEKARQILEAIEGNKAITIAKLEVQLGLGHTTLKKILREMQNENVIRRIGSDRGGYWEIIQSDSQT